MPSTRRRSFLAGAGAALWTMLGWRSRPAAGADGAHLPARDQLRPFDSRVAAPLVDSAVFPVAVVATDTDLWYVNRIENLDEILGPWSEPCLEGKAPGLPPTTLQCESTGRTVRVRDGWIFIPQATPLVVNGPADFTDVAVYGVVRIRQWLYTGLYAPAPESQAAITNVGQGWPRIGAYSPFIILDTSRAVVL